MSLYCMQCHKWATDETPHPCDAKHLISTTENMLPILLKAESLGLQVASAFCLTEPHNHSLLVQAELNFKCIYPEVLLQDLPTGWYWTDYVTVENKKICSSIAYDVEYVDNESFVYDGEQTVDGRIKQIIEEFEGYLDTRDPHAVRAIMILMGDL